MKNQIPNVVFIISDHHKFDYMGCAGNKLIKTPNIDKLAEKGTRISGMYSNAPLCVPSRICMTTGRYPMNTGNFSNRHPISPGSRTFINSLQDKGFHTAMIGKFHHHVHTLKADFIGHKQDVHDLGFDYVHETSGKQGIASIACECEYAVYLRSINQLEELRNWTGGFRKNDGTSKSLCEPWQWDDDTTQDAYIASKGVDFIKNVKKDTPFYLHLGFVGPHPPLDAPKRFHEIYSDVTLPQKKGEKERDSEYWRALAACITEIDEKIGLVYDALEQADLIENTIIFYTSDHGDMSGDFGLTGKVVFYEGSTHVPFIACGPNIQKGKVINTLAELIDLGQTVCDFMPANSHHYDQGISLKPLLTGEKETHREDVFVEMGSDKMLFDGKYKLMYGDLTRDTRNVYKNNPHNGPAFGRPVNLPPDQISLFNLIDDPNEENNLAEDPLYQEKLAEMKEQLLKRIIKNMQAVPDDVGSVM